ncbi:MAG: glycosyltransferase family 39 protein [Anaerolineae bacterium]
MDTLWEIIFSWSECVSSEGSGGVEECILQAKRLLHNKWSSLIAVLGLGFGLRMLRLDFQPLWWDEGWSVYFAASDVLTMVERTAEDIHPPFYYAALHLWMALFGPGSFAIRFFSVFVGTLTIPLLYIVGRHLFGSKVAILSALLLAIAPFHIFYSQEVRMYALVTLLGLASVYFMILLLGNGAARSSPGSGQGLFLWGGYVLSTSLVMYSQYYAVFLPLFQTLFVLGYSFAPTRFRQPPYPFLLRWFVGQLALLLLYLPWLIYAGSKLQAYVVGKVAHEAYQPLGLMAFVSRHLAAFSLGHLATGQEALYWFTVPLVALGILGAISAARTEKQSIQYGSSDHSIRSGIGPLSFGAILLLLYLLVPLMATYLLNLRFPFTPPRLERSLLFAVPAFYLLLARGLHALGRYKSLYLATISLILTVSGLALSGFYIEERYQQEDYRSLVQKVQRLAQPTDVVVLVHPWQAGYFRSYFRGELPQIYMTPSGQWGEEVRAGLAAMLDDGRRLWLPAYHALGGFLERGMEGYLAQQAYPVMADWFGATRLSFFAPGPELEETQSVVNFANRLKLVSYGVSPASVESAWGVVRVRLVWQRERPLEKRYHLGLRLTDQKGRAWGERDSEPVAGLRPTTGWLAGEMVEDRHGVLVPAGTPPGLYQVRLGVYSLENGGNLEVLDEDGNPQGFDVLLGTVRIIAPARPPTVDALAMQHPKSAHFADQIGLLGYNLGEGPFKAGQNMALILFWQAWSDVQEDYQVVIGLGDKEGRVWGLQKVQPVEGQYPTSQWLVGQFVRDLHDLLIPADTPVGEYQLVVGLQRVVGDELLPVAGGPTWGRNFVLLAKVAVAGREHLFERPSIAQPLVADLGDGVRLLGYDLTIREVEAGGMIPLTLYWQSLAPMTTSYTVFTHLIDGDERIWGQQDGIPGQGALPTTAWIEGEYIIDRYDIPVGTETPPGLYYLEVGMYMVSSGQRLPAFTPAGERLPADRVLLGQVQIVEIDGCGC